MQKQIGSGKITAISLLLIIGLSIIGVIAAISGGDIKQAISGQPTGQQPSPQPAPQD